jgi:hypothetical protein
VKCAFPNVWLYPLCELRDLLRFRTMGAKQMHRAPLSLMTNTTGNTSPRKRVVNHHIIGSIAKALTSYGRPTVLSLTLSMSLSCHDLSKYASFGP